MHAATRTAAIAALAIGGMLASPYAGAQAFVGGSLGASTVDRKITEGLITSGRVDGSDVAFKGFGGYQFHPNLAVEGAFVSLGTVRYDGDFGGIPVTNGRIDIFGLNASAVGLWPVSEKVNLFGKAGVFFWTADAKDNTGGVAFSGTKDGADVSLGVGMSYAITRNLVARIEGEYFKVDNANATMISAGLAYRFGR